MAVGTADMAVHIDDVREILEVGRLTALPRTPEFVRGVMNLRGAVVPVIDLAARLGQPAITIGRRSCVVVVEAGLPALDDSALDSAGDDEPEGHTHSRCRIDPPCRPAPYEVDERAPELADGEDQRHEAKRRGAKVIAIDPYRSLSAEKCHEWLSVRPGTDAAVALAMMHVLIRDDLLDHDYITRYTLGFEELRQHVKTWTPERAATISGSLF